MPIRPTKPRKRGGRGTDRKRDHPGWVKKGERRKKKRKPPSVQ